MPVYKIPDRADGAGQRDRIGKPQCGDYGGYEEGSGRPEGDPLKPVRLVIPPCWFSC